MASHHQQEQQPLHGILHPHDNDVLSGRGNFVNYHAGNENFRSLVRKHKVAYVACPKPQKGKFSKMIVDEVRALHPPGRFLKQDEVTKLWYDIGDKKAMDKTRQALREGAPDIMKNLGDDGDDENSDSPQSQQSPTIVGSASPLRQAPGRSVSCQPQLLSGLRRDSMGNYSAHSPSSYLSPQNIGLHNTIHSGARLQPMPSLHQAPNSMGSHSHHSHQLPQRTSSMHLSSAGNLASMQMMVQQQQNLSQSMHSPAHPQLSLSQQLAQLTQQSPQEQQQHLHTQQILHRQQQLLMQSQRRHHPMQQQQHSLPEHLPMSPHHQQQHSLQQQHLSMSQQAPSSHQQMQQQQQHIERMQQTFHDQTTTSNSMQIMPPLYQSTDMQNSSPAPVYSMGSSHVQYQPQEAMPAMDQSNSHYKTDISPMEFPRPLAPAPSAPQAPPLTFSSSLQTHKQLDDNSFGESERLAPLPSKTELKLSRDKLKREGSESSIQVDTIFPQGTTVKTKKNDGTNAATGDYKNHQSSSHLSVMSLSVGDMGLDDAVGEMPSQLAAIRSEKDLSNRFNTSLRLGQRSSRMSNKRHSLTGEEFSQAVYMDMSVATLGDRMSEYGESQANMSFVNVFEETDKDICQDGRLL
ncbi:hypothetical protein MPSEU_000666900 [Mayamaea pseudoterrestris]|nr:hypothetical protein MPSEU_000666900 [Mayamaea pseudoterrestris]